MEASGEGETNHHAEVEAEDLAKRYHNFDINYPTGLQELVWFNTMFYFIRCVGEKIRAMIRKTVFLSAPMLLVKEFIHQV